MKDWKISVENLLHYLPDDIRQKGEQMAESYLYLYTIENALRLFIDFTLKEKIGKEYFNMAANADMKRNLSNRMNNENNQKWVAVRGETELTQEELAVSIGKQRPALQRIEGGNINPSIYTLRKIAGGLGIKLEELLKDLIK